MSFKRPPDQELIPVVKEATDITFLNAGGFKAVYRCRIKGQPQALKLIQIPRSHVSGEEDQTTETELVHRVQREISILEKCRCPEIVKLGFLAPRQVEIAGEPYVIYSEELLDGTDLWKLLRSGVPKPPEQELKTLFKSLLLAIKELWGHKIIHRDIKPGNVMKLSDPKRPFVLLDLGIAFSRMDTPITSIGIPATHRYFAPEMANPNFRDTLDFRSDLYTAALTVFEYGAQLHPLARDFEDPMATISRAIRQTPKSFKEFRDDLSNDFCQIIDQMLKKIPALRPSNLDFLIKKMGPSQ